MPGQGFLSSVIAIYRRELQSYFGSPLAYLVAAIFWLLAGFFFTSLLFNLLQNASLADQQAQASGAAGPSYDMALILVQQFVSVLGTVSLFILPLLSMGLYAEERRRGTLELLATSPISSFAVAFGKWLAALTFYIGLLLPLLVYEGIALNGAEPAANPVLVLLAHLGLVLLAAVILSLGLCLSALTESTLLAAVATFGVVLFLQLADAAAESLGGPVGAILRGVSILTPFNDLTLGIVTTSGLVWFASLIVLGWFLTVQVVDGLRFQRG
ncbi:ABC transporter permease [Leptolyngbya sp. FACHB-261]|uniref:ABC transporter permease n=1 Tax=Leptolyngbya sp. FACHB-261 TaxID=2692806 RepID=UPI0016824EE6|nr:ABC transporter permease [Leptolyngbya sp. FACHB-261]MBD2101437.1 ABC transporter permease subunit [Leptolyngbya sp. FACHB-261]